MTVRTAFTGTASPGDVFTAENTDDLPGGWIGYAEVTGNQTSITTEANLTSLTVTVTTNTSRRIKISGKCEMSSTQLGDAMTLNIKESTTVLQRAVKQAFGAGQSQTLTAACVLTPSAGSHTYFLSASCSGGGTGQMNAAATYPAFILCEDLGPAS